MGTCIHVHVSYDLNSLKVIRKYILKQQRRSQFMWTFIITNTRVFNLKISLRYVGYL